MTARKPRPQVWLVEDAHNAPGRINALGRTLAVFYSRRDAEDFAESLTEPAYVIPRTLYYGQPPNRGFNP